jgi:hypothetical protein
MSPMRTYLRDSRGAAVLQVPWLFSALSAGLVTAHCRPVVLYCRFQVAGGGFAEVAAIDIAKSLRQPIDVLRCTGLVH